MILSLLQKLYMKQQKLQHLQSSQTKFPCVLVVSSIELYSFHCKSNSRILLICHKLVDEQSFFLKQLSIVLNHPSFLLFGST
jgi:hypothetical protein